MEIHRNPSKSIDVHLVSHRSSFLSRGANYPPLDPEAMLEDGEVLKLVHRVAVVLGSGDAFDKVCRDVFEQHAAPHSEAIKKRRLPTTAIPEVYERLKIPVEHMRAGQHGDFYQFSTSFDIVSRSSGLFSMALGWFFVGTFTFLGSESSEAHLRGGLAQRDELQEEAGGDPREVNLKSYCMGL